MELLDKIYIGKLIDIYGNLLTSKQLSALSGYCYNDLSLTEIAENEEITRQAAYDLVLKAKNSLEKYESVVGKYEMLERVKKELGSILETTKDESVLKRINKIIENLE